MRRYRLRAVDRVLELGAGAGGALIMGVVNASPDSFSDGGRYGSLEERVELALAHAAAGADILDVGGESATTGRPPVAVAEEIERVVPLIERIVAELERDRSRYPAGEGWVGHPEGERRVRHPVGEDPVHPVVSIDTYKPPVARAAIAAGARIVNDVSGLRDPELAAVCAESGAALVLMHTAAAPRVRRQDPDLYTDVVGEVLDFLRAQVAVALEAGVSREQLILDPGPDFAKTPAQTIALLAQLERLHELELPLLMAISRKDFIGALTGRPPRERLAGTLAALAHGVDAGAHIFRVHDVAAAADFLAVRAALAREVPAKRDLALPEELRHQRAPRGSRASEFVRRMP
jgi:dihydropteroate synthase